MRTAGLTDHPFLLDKDNPDAPAFGVILPGGGCAEHEHGIDGIHEAMGISRFVPNEDLHDDSKPKIKIGLDRYTMGSDHQPRWPRAYFMESKYFSIFGVTRSVIHLVDHDESAYEKREIGQAVKIKKFPRSLINFHWQFSSTGKVRSYDKKFKTIEELETHLEQNPKMKITGFWDDSGFCVFGVGAEGRDVVKNIHDAYEKKDLAVWSGRFSGNPFAVGGLVIAVASQVPQHSLDLMYNSHLDALKLEVFVANTRIKETLASSGLRYFALAPAWANDDKTEVKFFLNPMDQGKHNFGWYTLKDLEEWAKGAGPIVKSPSYNHAPQM